VAAALFCLLLLLGAGAGYRWFYFRHYDFWEAQRALKLDLLADAQRHVDLYLQSAPDDLEGHLLAVRIDRLLERFAEAEKHLHDCKRLAGMTDRVQLEWLLLRAFWGEIASVDSGLRYSLEKEEQAVLVLEGLAYGYQKELRHVASLVCLDKWLKREPESVRALSWRGWVHENLEAKDEAMDDYKRALELSPQHTAARLALAKMLLFEKKIPQAAEHLQILESAKPGNPGVIFLLAECRMAQARNDEAAVFLDKLLALQPNNMPALHQRGRLAAELGEKEKWFRKALELDPSFLDARYSLYTCLLQQPGRRAEAALELKKYQQTQENWTLFKKTLQALEQSPQDPDLLATAADVLWTTDPSVAQRFLAKALSVSPDHPRAREILARERPKYEQLRKAAVKP
jgi:tetratricopeptide (TPR) repeat protein